MAKSEASKIKKSKLATDNLDNAIRSVVAINNMKREAIRESQESRGIIPSNEMTPVMLAIEKMEEKDRQSREEARDDSHDILGVARVISFRPRFELVLHDKAKMIYLGELCQKSNIVVGMDGSGGMFDAIGTKSQGKFQHLLMLGSFTQSMLTKEEMAVTKRYDFNPFLMSERISDTNTAGDVGRWVRQVRNDVKEAMWSKRRANVDLTFGLVMADQAGQIITGTLEGLFREGMVDSQITYHNMSLLALLRFEGRANNQDPNMLKINCDETMKVIQTYSPSAFNQCKVHVYDAQRNGAKHMRNKPAEIRANQTSFDKIFEHLARDVMLETKSIAKIIARVSYVIAFFETEFFDLDSMDVDSETSEHHNSDESKHYSSELIKLCISEARQMTILSDEEMHQKIADVMGTVKKQHMQRFNGEQVAKGAISLFKSKVKAFPYLSSVDKEKKKGAINVVAVVSHFCFEGSPKKDKRQIKPFRVRLTVEVDLPFKDGRIRNPWFSPRAGAYWRGCLTSIALTSRLLLTVAGTSWNVELHDTNQSVEGFLRGMKHYRSDARESLAFIPPLIESRFKDGEESGTLLSIQLSEAKIKRDTRLEQQQKKEKEKQAAARNEVRDDKIVREEDSNMNWDRKGKGVIAQRGRDHERMYESLKAAMKKNRDKEDAKMFVYKPTSNTSMRKVLTYYGSQLQPQLKFATDPTFNKWMKGETEALPERAMTILDLFWKEYVGNVPE